MQAGRALIKQMNVLEDMHRGNKATIKHHKKSKKIPKFWEVSQDDTASRVYRSGSQGGWAIVNKGTLLIRLDTVL